MADEVAIRVEHVGKSYRLGATGLDGPRGLLSEQIGGLLRAPLRLAGRGGSGSAATRDSFWALRDVSLEVKRGEVVGLIGANGAGKSTLLKLLARITPPTEGRITLTGRVASMLEVGTGFHPELTGRENVYLNGTILGMRRHEISARFDDIAEFSGVERFLDTPVKRYSSGMYVRLAFAVAAHLQPEILLVDEVLAVGDAEFQRKCLGKMEEVVETGRTIVFVSHNLSAVQRLCARSVWIDRGRVAHAGPTTEVIADYIGRARAGGEGGDRVVTEDAQRLGTGEAQLRRLALLGGDGRATDRLFLGQELWLRLTIEAVAPVEDLIVEVGVNAADGSRVLTTQNVDRGQPPATLPAGMIEIEVRAAAHLLPGEFTLDVGMTRSNGSTVDIVQQVLAFTSLNVSQDASDVWPWPVVRGSVRPEADWTVRPVEAAASTRSR